MCLMRMFLMSMFECGCPCFDTEGGMNGAQALIRTLVSSGVDVCFANPGTSEMHFVAALDAVPEMRALLALFEGTATGAADGYGRMADRPAAALLHLGPGLGNGLANLHNARRARTPLVAIVGDHAAYHSRYDAPLESDIEVVAGSVSGWVRRSVSAADAGADAAGAVAAAAGPPGQVATLILPADGSWPARAGRCRSAPTRASRATWFPRAVRCIRSAARQKTWWLRSRTWPTGSPPGWRPPAAQPSGRHCRRGT